VVETEVETFEVNVPENIKMKKNKVLIVIPSRIGSTRLPGKPLIEINGKPLIQYVYEGALQSKLANKLVVATDSKKILKCVQGFGGEAILTSPKHKTGSDRVAEVVKKMPEYNIIINVQGDMPFVNGKLVDILIKPLIEKKDVQMAALKSKIKNKNDLLNPSITKVVTDRNNFALYYTRTVIPYNMSNSNIIYYKNKGIYGFKRDFLLKYVRLPQGNLEKAESLEQLRSLEYGHKIYVVETDIETFDVNVPEDVGIIEKEIKKRRNAK